MLHVYQVYQPDDFTGIPRVIWELCEEMAKLGVESEVLCLSENPSPEPIRVGRHQVHQVRRDFRIASANFSLAFFKKFKELIGHFDLIHYHYPCPIADLLYLALGRDVPSVVTYHSDIVKQRTLDPLYAPIRFQFLNGVERIVATSPNYFASSKTLARHKVKTSIVPIGIGDRIIPDTSSVMKWRSRVGDGFFLFVGALRYYKGIEFLIDAARITGVKVVIAGRGKINLAHLPENVTYVGEVSDVDKECLLSLCKAFVFPSHLRSEAFGVALIEAARAGRPLISCEIGTGTSFVNVSGETGIEVSPGNAFALGQAMQILRDNTHIAEKYGRNATKRFENLFKSEMMSSGYLNVYQYVVGKATLHT